MHICLRPVTHINQFVSSKIFCSYSTLESKRRFQRFDIKIDMVNVCTAITRHDSDHMETVIRLHRCIALIQHILRVGGSVG